MPTDPVLVATALDAAGVTAIQEAAAWAERRGAPLIVAHALPSRAAIMPLLPHLVNVIPSADLRGKAEAALEAHVAEALGNAGAAERVVVEGSAHAAILGLAEKTSPQLVVVSHSEKAAIERAVLGSTAEQVTRSAPCSVLVVRGRGGSGPIVAATDLSDAAFPAVQAAGAEASRREAELVVLHALDVAQPFTALVEPTATLDEATVTKLSEAANELLAAIVARFRSFREHRGRARTAGARHRRSGGRTWRIPHRGRDARPQRSPPHRVGVRCGRRRPQSDVQCARGSHRGVSETRSSRRADSCGQRPAPG